MKHNLELKLQVVVPKMPSSSIYYLILMWLVRVVVVVLRTGQCILMWVLKPSFSLIRECLRRYLSEALFGKTLSAHSRTQDTDHAREKMTRLIGSLSWVEEEAADQLLETTSLLLPIVLRDRVQICEENLAIEDRERLLYEFEKIVAPQVSSFQLGEIVVPINDTLQLATFLKLKLGQTCKSQSTEDINATVCGAILNIQSNGAISNCVESWSQNHDKIVYFVVYIAARLQGDNKIHLVFVGRKVEDIIGSSEFRNRFNPPRTRGDEEEWLTWTLTHIGSLRTSAVQTAEELLFSDPVHAQVW